VDINQVLIIFELDCTDQRWAQWCATYSPRLQPASHPV
jgi:hypothetical protein